MLGYFPFFVVDYWVHDMKCIKRQAAAVAALLTFDAVCLVVFGPVLGWIYPRDTEMGPRMSANPALLLLVTALWFGAGSLWA